MNPCELEVPVPWGHISAKAWGDPTNKIVIALHGLIDNAGTFDTLIPLLPQSFYYLCIDLPGHGFSSHFPPGLPIYFFNYIFAMRYVTDHFKRKKYIFLAHSFGGKVAMAFAKMYPHMVSKLAVIDSGFLTPNRPDALQSLINADDLIKRISSSQRPPSYSYEETVRRVKDSRYGGSLTIKTAQQLADRMIKRVGDDKYEFTYDRRLRAVIHGSYDTEDYIVDMYRKNPIRCPAILIYSTGTVSILGNLAKYYFEIPNFECHEIEGHHHSHHTNPERVAPILTEFLLRGESKL